MVCTPAVLGNTGIALICLLIALTSAQAYCKQAGAWLVSVLCFSASVILLCSY